MIKEQWAYVQETSLGLFISFYCYYYISNRVHVLGFFTIIPIHFSFFLFCWYLIVVFWWRCPVPLAFYPGQRVRELMWNNNNVSERQMEVCGAVELEVFTWFLSTHQLFFNPIVFPNQIVYWVFTFCWFLYCIFLVFDQKAPGYIRAALYLLLVMTLCGTMLLQLTMTRYTERAFHYLRVCWLLCLILLMLLMTSHHFIWSSDWFETSFYVMCLGARLIELGIFPAVLKSQLIATLIFLRQTNRSRYFQNSLGLKAGRGGGALWPKLAALTTRRKSVVEGTMIPANGHSLGLHEYIPQLWDAPLAPLFEKPLCEFWYLWPLWALPPIGSTLSVLSILEWDISAYIQPGSVDRKVKNILIALNVQYGLRTLPPNWRHPLLPFGQDTCAHAGAATLRSFIHNETCPPAPPPSGVTTPPPFSPIQVQMIPPPLSNESPFNDEDPVCRSQSRRSSSMSFAKSRSPRISELPIRELCHRFERVAAAALVLDDRLLLFYCLQLRALLFMCGLSKTAQTRLSAVCNRLLPSSPAQMQDIFKAVQWPVFLPVLHADAFRQVPPVQDSAFVQRRSKEQRFFDCIHSLDGNQVDWDADSEHETTGDTACYKSTFLKHFSQTYDSKEAPEGSELWAEERKKNSTIVPFEQNESNNLPVSCVLQGGGSSISAATELDCLFSALDTSSTPSYQTLCALFAKLWYYRELQFLQVPHPTIMQRWRHSFFILLSHALDIHFCRKTMTTVVWHAG